MKASPITNSGLWSFGVWNRFASSPTCVVAFQKKVLRHNLNVKAFKTKGCNWHWRIIAFHVTLVVENVTFRFSLMVDFNR